MRDLKFALRLLNKHRLFSLAIIVTMALAIGVNTSAFSILSALLLRPVPVQNPGRLMKLHMSNQQDNGMPDWLPWSYADYVDYRDGTASVFSGMALYKGIMLTTSKDGSGRGLEGGAVTRDFFRVMGIRPLLGRTFPSNEKMPSTPVYDVVISKRFWRSHFAGSADVLHKMMTLGGHRFEIIGVVDGHGIFEALQGQQYYWITLGTLAAMGRGCRPLDARGVYCEQAFARLKPGHNVAAAQQALNIVSDRLAQKYPKTNKHMRAVAHSANTLYGLLGADRHRVLLISLSLMGVAIAILLIACANIVNLFLARGARRVHEVAVRMALGAKTTAIARQLLVEAAVLSILGAGGGLLAGWFGIGYVRRVSVFEQLSVTLDWRVGLFTALVALGAGLLFSLVPMLPVRRMDLSTQLGVTNSALNATGTGVRDALVVVQVALSLGLLVSAGLFIRTLNNAYRTDLGFNAAHVLVARLQFASGDAPPRTVLNRISSQMKRLPGVDAVGFTNMAPLSGSRMFYSGIESPGFTRKQQADAEVVADGYFDALGVPLLQGDNFSDLPPGNDKVVLVNASFAKLWPKGWRSGRHLKLGKTTYTVAGVVGDVHHNGVRNALVPRVYLRYPPSHTFGQHYILNMVVRTRDAAVGHQAAVAKALKRLDPAVTVTETFGLISKVKKILLPVAQITAFLVIFAFVALALAVLGIYALLAYLVTQRTAEIGMRQALGAQYWDIVGLFARKSAVLVAIGSALGLTAAVLVMRALQHFLYDVTPVDPPTLAGSVIVFACIAAIAIAELLNRPEDDAVSVARARVEPGSATRWHRLRDTAERYVILEGRGRAEIGGEAPRDVRPGDVVVIPPNAAQRIANFGEGDLVFLAVCTPRFRDDVYES